MCSSDLTSGEDLSSLRDELSELSYVLVINVGYLVLAEDANLLSLVHRTEGSALSIVSIHFRIIRNLSDSHILYFYAFGVSLAEGELTEPIRKEGSRRWEFLQKPHSGVRC